MARIATSLLFHSTALATSLIGLPVMLPIYSRAYGQSTCTPTDTSGINQSNVSTTTFTCSTASGTLNQTQVFYGGYATWYENTGVAGKNSANGLNIDVTNGSMIVVTGTSVITSFAPTTSLSTFPYLPATSGAGLLVLSQGNTAGGGTDHTFGGNGGDISVTNTANISAADGPAIYVKSSGGSNPAYLSDPEPGIALGAGGMVTVTSSGNISAGAGGVLAISQGGRGGYDPQFPTHPGAGEGGPAGAVAVVVSGDILAGGVGILAASYGGDGGEENGKASTSEDIWSPGGAAGTASVTASDVTVVAGAVGGILAISRGGSSDAWNGGDADSVAIILTNGSVSVAGDNAPGVMALSKGGTSTPYSGINSGGTAGAASVIVTGDGSVVTTGDNASGIVSASLGGQGRIGSTEGARAYGGPASSAYLKNTFDVTTQGAQSHGIVATSAGAGGGFFSDSGAGIIWGDQQTLSYSGNDVTVWNSGAVSTSGADSGGIVAQSIGGAGGLLTATATIDPPETLSLDDFYAMSQRVGGYSVNVSGGTVLVYNSNTITTTGGSNAAGGIGILAQSLGGGGGLVTGSGAQGALGGSGPSTGDAGGPGGTVTVRNYAGSDITTGGEEGHGIVAQSIGGGGGAGRNEFGLFFAVGGAGGAGGGGGAVTVTNDSAIMVSGDYADGIIVQSVGGGGGVGGQASTWGSGFGFTRAVGGTGGNGGYGGTVDVNLGASSQVVTKGTAGIAVLAQSIGGGGGVGGATHSVSYDGFLVSVAKAFGGSGGDGGSGGAVTVSSAGDIMTYGTDSTAILAQSVGGGGGQGGSASAKAVADAENFIPQAVQKAIDLERPVKLGISVSIAQGGTGGQGGDGGDVRVINNVSSQTLLTEASVTTSSGTVAANTEFSGIATFGDGATGLMVQSIGGGGGAGGDSTALATAGTALLEEEAEVKGLGAAAPDWFSSTSPLEINLAVAVSKGGSGGTGGDGRTAYGLNRSDIHTYGLFADAIIVQSIGGGGGAGGFGSATGSAYEVGVDVAVAHGAQGGVGGKGGDVYAGNSGMIVTSGSDSRGIVVQSIGGGGGISGGGQGINGRKAGVAIGQGAAGVSGVDAGSVTVWNAGSIATHGDWSDGILAQSIAGGGGVAGAGDSALTLPGVLPTPDSTNTFSVYSGAQGGAGGNGGTVVVGKTPSTYAYGTADAVVSGSIVTHGILSNGITAQSIGAGGGSSAVSSGNDVSTSGTSTASISLGSAGGSGGDGGTVSVYAGDITTYGFGSHGVVAQSVGGGGGSSATSGFAIPTIEVRLGGSGTATSYSQREGSYGSGGTVTITTIAGSTITTGKNSESTDAFGILAQSIGGGGGVFLAAQGDASNASGASPDGALSITVGSTLATQSGTALDDVSSDGGDVTVNANGTIVTYGARDIAIAAQSIGGGGGTVSAPSASIGSVSFVSEGVVSDAGTVAVTMGPSAQIVTSGDGAIGIFAQSVAGGGGLFADTTQQVNISTSSGGAYTYDTANGATQGASGGVNVTVYRGASITTHGAYAHGIMAQALTGGGGVFQKNGKTYAGSLGRGGASSGDVDVAVDGSVAVSGQGAWAVWTQAGGSSSITLTGTGALLSNGAAGGAIYSDAVSTTVDVGTSASVRSTGGTAIAATGAVTVTNHGLVQGDLLLTENGQFTNAIAGTLISGKKVEVDTFTNYGSINIAGTGTFGTLHLDGTLSSATDTGYGCGTEGCITATYYSSTNKQYWRSGLIVDLDVNMETGQSDQFDVELFEGVTGVLLGSDVSLLPNTTVALYEQTSFMQYGAVTVLPTMIYQFSIGSYIGNDAGFSVASADFTPTGWGSSDKNVMEAADGMNKAWTAYANDGSAVTDNASVTMGKVFGAFYSATPDNYESMLSDLYSSTSLAPLATATESAFSTASSVLSCPDFVPGSALLEEGSCVWGRALGGTADRSATTSSAGFSGSGAGLQAGVQKEVADNWFLGSTIGYLASRYEGDGRSETLDTTTAFGAVALKHQIGPWLFALAAGGGYSWGESTRSISLGPLAAVAEGSPDSSFLFGRARASYQFVFGETWYAKPILDLDVVAVNQSGYTESGAGALNLMVDSASSVFFGVTPAIEFGARAQISPGVFMRPYLDLGVSFFSSDEWTAQARFAGAPGMTPFETSAPIADTVGRIMAGLDVYGENGVEVKVQYGANIAEDYFAQSGSLRLGVKF